MLVYNGVGFHIQVADHKMCSWNWGELSSTSKVDIWKLQVDYDELEAVKKLACWNDIASEGCD